MKARPKIEPRGKSNPPLKSNSYTEDMVTETKFEMKKVFVREKQNEKPLSSQSSRFDKKVSELNPKTNSRIALNPIKKPLENIKHDTTNIKKNILTPKSVSTIDANINSNSVQKSEEVDEYEEVFKSIGLAQYIKSLKESGFNSLANLVNISTEDLVTLKIPSGHQIKILKKLKELKSNLPFLPEQANNFIDTDGGIQIRMIKSEQSKRESQKANEKKESFEKKTTGTNLSPRTNSSKMSCWECYKIFFSSENFKFNKKDFCSERCVQSYRLMNQFTCAKIGCNKLSLKEEGMFIEGRWYCGDICAPSMEEIMLQEQAMLAKLARGYN